MSEPSVCGATTRSGSACRNRAGHKTDHLGYGNCWLHGGATPTGKKHAETRRQEAWARILELTDPALSRLAHLIDGAETDTVRLAAARDVLDRAGLGAKHVHEHTGPGGGPIPVEVRAAELLERARKLRPPATRKPVTRKKATLTGKKASSAKQANLLNSPKVQRKRPDVVAPDP